MGFKELLMKALPINESAIMQIIGYHFLLHHIKLNPFMIN